MMLAHDHDRFCTSKFQQLFCSKPMVKLLSHSKYLHHVRLRACHDLCSLATLPEGWWKCDTADPIFREQQAVWRIHGLYLDEISASKYARTRARQATGYSGFRSSGQATLTSGRSNHPGKSSECLCASTAVFYLPVDDQSSSQG